MISLVISDFVIHSIYYSNLLYIDFIAYRIEIANICYLTNVYP